MLLIRNRIHSAKRAYNSAKFPCINGCITLQFFGCQTVVCAYHHIPSVHDDCMYTCNYPVTVCKLHYNPVHCTSHLLVVLWQSNWEHLWMLLVFYHEMIKVNIQKNVVILNWNEIFCENIILVKTEICISILLSWK